MCILESGQLRDRANLFEASSDADAANLFFPTRRGEARSARDRASERRGGLVADDARAALALAREQLEQQQADADDDAAVRDVEVGPAEARPELEVEEVDHLAAPDAVDQVSD